MTPHDLETESYVFWRAHGCDHLHSSAWCGNEAGETSFRTDRPVGDRNTGGGYGPAQHHNARINIIKSATGIDIKTADLLKTNTMEEAITVLVNEFEKSAIRERDIRRRTALGNHYLEEFKSWTQPSKHFFLARSSV
jgi:hypothetical protein